MRGPATAIVRRPGTRSSRDRVGGDRHLEQVVTDAGTADGDDADQFVVAVAELGTPLARPRSGVGGVKPVM